jgi:cytochrome P450
MADPRFGVHPLRPLAGDDGGFQVALSGPESVGDLLRIDPPDHTELRQKLTRYFTVRQVEQKRSGVERIVNDRLSAMEEAGPPVDFVGMFALPVACLTLCELLGVPGTESENFERPSEVIADTFGTTLAEKQAAVEEFYEFAWSIITEKRAHPGDDPLSDLITTGGLSDDQLKGTTLLLFAAGHHTTATMFGASVFFLLSEPERWRKACSDQSAIDPMVEELLRYLMTTNTMMPRTAREDVEIDGVLIKKGEAVAVVPGRPGGDLSACPHLREYDPAHDTKAHLAFGHGRHMCLGQHLARLELQVGLAALMRRFPALSLAEPAEQMAWFTPWGTDYNKEAQIAKDRLPVTW